MNSINFSAEAELFPPRHNKFSDRHFRYRRFATLAVAVRFAVEELPAEVLFGSVIEADEERYDAPAIRRLYESSDYPLDRVATSGLAAA